jgi:serine/threonine-protein kinase
MQAAEALAVAHASGIVHRDVKPENLFLARRADGTDVVKVLDFGISKAALTGSVFSGDMQPLKTQELMGTPLYMSPEQIRCTATVDHRTDIWSLGVVLYELVTGVMPFHGEAVTEICARVLEASPPPLSSYLPDVPGGLQAVIDRCFQKDPAKRFQNVAELAISLLPFAPALARILAERTSTIMRAAGHVVPISMRFQSSRPPPSSSTSLSIATIPAAPSLPSFSVTPPQRPSQLSMTNPEALDAIVKEARSTRRFVLGASVVVLALGGGAAVYLLKMSRPAPASSAAAARAAESATRLVALDSDPAGARVVLEGKLLGETPLTVQLAPGSHAVEVAKEGFLPETLSLTIAAGETENRRFRITLKPLNPGALAAAARSAGTAAVSVRPPAAAARPWGPAAVPLVDSARRAADPPVVSATPAPTVVKSARPNAGGEKRPTVHVIGDDQINVKVIE